MKVQITLFDKNKHYRPISTIVEVADIDEYKKNKKKIHSTAIQNICHNRNISYQELSSQGYTTLKAREYDKEKIARNKEKVKQQEIKNILKECKKKRLMDKTDNKTEK